MKILSNIDEVRKYCSIGRDTQFDDLEGKFLKAARKWVVPMIGQSLTNVMVDYYNDGAPDETDVESLGLLYLLQEAVANLGLFLYVPEANAQLGSDGINQSQNENSGPAAWWAVKDLIRNYAQNGEEALDEILNYLEEHINDFAEWGGSAERELFAKGFVKTTAEFQKGHNIYHSRRTFMALKPIMEEVEDLYLEPQLTLAAMDEIKAIANPTAVEKTALELVKKAVINFTVVRACSTNLFSITSDGMRSRSIMTVNSYLERFTPAEEEQVMKTQREKERTANAYLGRLVKHLNENASATVFPAYFNSDKYEDPAEDDNPSLTHNTKGFLGI